MTRRLAWLTLAAAAATAHAQPATSPTSPDARAALARGESLVQAGEYERALAELDRGQKLEPHPVFLYAKGQAYRLLGDCVHAVAQFEAYLDTQPPANMAEAARKNIDRCPRPPEPRPKPEPAAPPSPVPTAPTTTTAPPAPPAPPAPLATSDEPARPRAPDEPWFRDRTTLALGAGSALALGAAVTLLALGDRDIRSANGAHTLRDYQQLGDRGTRERVAGAVCAVAGGALAIGAVAHHVLAGHRARAVAVAPGRSSVVVLWSAPW